jgi:hypothetical protein
MEKLSRFDKCRIALEKGITCNPETGIIIGIRDEKIGWLDTEYIKFRVNYKEKHFDLKAHIFIYYCKYGEYDLNLKIDHINRIKDDNRIENLRLTTHSENLQNTNAKGYSFDKKHNKYRACIQINKKKIDLGYFKLEEDARNAYIEAKKIYHIH